MKNEIKKEYVPLETLDYVPAVVKRLLRRIHAEASPSVALYGFSDNMKWLCRLLRQQGSDPVLCDWREEFVSYDCGGTDLVPVAALNDDPSTLLVICVEEIHEIKAAIRYLIDRKLNRMAVIYDRTEEHSPFHQEEPFKGIA